MATLQLQRKKETFNHFGLYDSFHKQHRCINDSIVHGITEKNLV